MSTHSKLGTPIKRINAAHSGAAASATPPDQAGGLEPVIFPAQNAKVCYHPTYGSKLVCVIVLWELLKVSYMLKCTNHLPSLLL